MNALLKSYGLRTLPLVTSIVLCPGLVLAQNTDLTEMSLEELMAIEVMTVSRADEDLAESPAAIRVLTREDIRRSGADNVAEALRLIPGVQVSRIHTNAWAISSRGFAGRLANKLLVMVDGRSMYSPVFSGVHWETLDLVLEDIERIEVVHGPGGAMWGANAVNGVINIITRSAHETQGTYARSGAATHDGNQVVLRHGEATSGHAWRVYGKGDRRGSFDLRDGSEDAGFWSGGSVGLRADSATESSLQWRVSADGYAATGEESFSLVTIESPTTQLLSFPGDHYGASISAQASLEKRGRWQVRAWWDLMGWEGDYIDERVSNVDLDLQHSGRRGRHDLMWGASARRISARVFPTQFVQSIEQDPQIFWTAFVQDRISLASDRLRWTVGTKLEDHQDHSIDWQPTTRLAWVRPRKTTWAAVSRAVRSPSMLETRLKGTLRVVEPSSETMGLPVELRQYASGTSFVSEKFTTFELGHRQLFENDIHVEFSAFHSRISGLSAYAMLSPVFHLFGASPYIEQPIVRQNALNGTSSGGELRVMWQSHESLRWSLSQSLVTIDLEPSDRDQPLLENEWRFAESNTPRHQTQLTTRWDPTAQWHLDQAITASSRNHALDVAPWVRWDARISREFKEGLELALVGRNLLRTRHREWTGSLGELETYPGRLLIVSLDWRH